MAATISDKGGRDGNRRNLGRSFQRSFKTETIRYIWLKFSEITEIAMLFQFSEVFSS